MKYAFVTGGTRGIGLAVCKLFCEAGYAVTATYSHGEEDACRARELLPAVRFLRADVSDEGAVSRALADMPALDVLVNNAGIACCAQVQDTAFADYERVTNVNFGGTFLCCKHAVKKLLARGGGAIVNVSSVWGETGGSCESVYSASKGAVISFTKALAKELAPSNIQVNAIACGIIDTDMNRCFSEEERYALKEEVPAGRFGSPEEIARVALSLVEAPSYLTGQIITVDGGWI